MKVTGEELRDFLDNGWPHDDAWWDGHGEAFWCVSESDKPDPKGGYDLRDAGFIIYDGPTKESSWVKSFLTCFRAWRKKKTTMSFHVVIPKTDEAALRELAKEKKWTITS